MALDDDKMKEITHKFMTKDDGDLGKHKVYAHEHRKQLRRVVLKTKLKERKLRIKEKLREQKIQKQLQKEFEEKRREEERRMKEEQKRAQKESARNRERLEKVEEIPQAPQKQFKGHVELGKDEIPKEYSLEAEQETPAHHIRAKIFGKAKQTSEESEVQKLKLEKEDDVKRQQEVSTDQKHYPLHQESKKPFVELACAKCSKILRPHARFCDHCGSNKIMKVEEEVKEEAPKPKGSSWGMKLVKFLGWLIVILLVLGGLALVAFWVLLNYFDIKFV